MDFPFIIKHRKSTGKAKPWILPAPRALQGSPCQERAPLLFQVNPCRPSEPFFLLSHTPHLIHQQIAPALPPKYSQNPLLHTSPLPPLRPGQPGVPRSFPLSLHTGLLLQPQTRSHASPNTAKCRGAQGAQWVKRPTLDLSSRHDLTVR